MRTTILLLFIALGFALGLQLAPAWAFTTHSQEDICATEAVIFCDNFENRPLGLANVTLRGVEYKNGGWAVGNDSSDTSQAVVNTDHFDGTKSMQWTYPVNGGASWIEGRYSALPEIYYRFYIKNSSNWVWSGNGNKLSFVGNATIGHNIMIDQGIFGDNKTVLIPQYGSPATWYYQNVASVSWPLNKWVCTEMHFKANTVGQANGAIEGWIDGIKVFNYSAVNLDKTSGAGTFSQIGPSGYWNCTTGQPINGSTCDTSSQANQHPTMYRWIDNVVVSTQRIGCLGAPIAGDATPPSAPIGLSIR
ncbi:MAG: hypothetical protein L0Z46_00340 [Nitrospiraceae bacterium]|nr:hypothetical protein [Nitrospiraceae bacterium]